MKLDPWFLRVALIPLRVGSPGDLSWMPGIMALPPALALLAGAGWGTEDSQR